MTTIRLNIQLTELSPVFTAACEYASAKTLCQALGGTLYATHAEPITTPAGQTGARTLCGIAVPRYNSDMLDTTIEAFHAMGLRVSSFEGDGKILNINLTNESAPYPLAQSNEGLPDYAAAPVRNTASHDAATLSAAQSATQSANAHTGVTLQQPAPHQSLPHAPRHAQHPAFTHISPPASPSPTAIAV